MIIAVSMNPSVDKTLYVKDFRVGYLNRIESVTYAPGGKGINVANDLASFTGEVLISGFIGTSNELILYKCIDDLKDRGVKADFVSIDDRNRTNVKIIEDSGRLTEINEPGFCVPEDKVKELFEKLMSYAGEDNVFLLTGSVPKGVSKDFYRLLTLKLKELGSKVYVDADGELFKNAIESVPTAIKPNESELLEYFGDTSVSEKHLINRAKELVDKGIETVIVSRGQKGSLFVKKDSVYRCNAPVIKGIRSAVGAGDAMFATYAYCDTSGIDYMQNIRLTVASAAATVSLDTPYFTESDVLDKYVDAVTIEEL